MAMFSKESLETLRQRIDIIEVLSAHVDLKKSGAVYKGICPFHDEKTPSFTIHKGDAHYHCFGCGAHGDAIQFLMTHHKLSFFDAVESLAQTFNVPLQKVEFEGEKQGADKGALKQALEYACRLYHFYLLHSAEGHQALHYLYSRGIDLDFIRYFQVGLAPKIPNLLRKAMHNKFFSDVILQEAGLIVPSNNGGYREFFTERITIPIRDSQGSVIGFSARKYKNDTFGGKYVNSTETPLFKKSRILFGLNYCRKRIAKERQALIVEGQIDALRLIYLGFNIAVASQGTAFGEGHVKELLNLGVNRIYIATDGDHAGQEAALKIGHLLQREGVDVLVTSMPLKLDPDSFLCEYGPDAFQKLMENSVGYLDFLIKQRAITLNSDSPAGKNELVQTISKQIREWKSPLMIHEGLKRLAHVLHIPEDIVGVGSVEVPNIYIKKQSIAGMCNIDPDRILEFDCLRWLLLLGENQPQLLEIAQQNLQPTDFKNNICRIIYQLYVEHSLAGKRRDLLSLATELDDSEAQGALSEILQRKINLDRAELHFTETIQRMLERNWMEKREDIKRQIQSGNCSDDEATELVQQFDALKRQLPQVKPLEGKK